VFDATSPASGRHNSLVLPWAGAECMSVFLREVGRRRPGEHVPMFMD
jgi:hypothetical protein